MPTAAYAAAGPIRPGRANPTVYKADNHVTRELGPVKLCLISPPIIVANRVSLYQHLPPMGVAYLAAAARHAGYEVTVVDGLGEAPDTFQSFVEGRYINGLTIEELVRRVDRNCDVIGLSAMLSVNWPLVRRLLAALRKAFPSTPLVVGGEHVTAAMNHVFDSAPVDYAVLGEGEETLLELLAALGNPGQRDLAGIEGLAYRAGQDALLAAGKAKSTGHMRKDAGPASIVRTAARKRRRDLDSLPWPAWDLLPIHNYMESKRFAEVSDRRVMTMLGTRGCPYRCRFCTSAQMWTTRFYMRSPEDIVDEMQFYRQRYGATEFQFQDLTFVVNRKWVIRVADEIRARDLNIVWKLPAGTRSEAVDVELLTRLRASGCTSVAFAPESGSKRVLAAMQKKADPARFLEIGRIIRRARIDLTLHAYFIIGCPEERLRDLLQTYVFLVKLALVGYDTVCCNKFSCYPGSEYHRRFLERGLIEYNDDYFLKLDGNFASRSRGQRWHPRWSDRRVGWLVTIGYVLFFSVYYLSKPRRALRCLIGVVRSKPRTRLERVISHALTVRLHWFRRRWDGYRTVPPADNIAEGT